MTSNLAEAQRALAAAQRAAIVARASRLMDARAPSEPQPETLDAAARRAARHEDVVALLDAGRFELALERALAEIDHADLDRFAEGFARFDPSRELLASEPRIERLRDGRFVATTPARGYLHEPSEHHAVAEAHALEAELARNLDPKITDLDRIELGSAVDALVRIVAIVIVDRYAETYDRIAPGRPRPSWLREPVVHKLGTTPEYARGAGRVALPLLAGRLRELANAVNEVADAHARIVAARQKLAERDAAVRARLEAEPTEAELAALDDDDDDVVEVP
jgi:hypothetical protein